MPLHERPGLRDRVGVFRDRGHAGEVLAGMLDEFRGSEATVLAIPRDRLTAKLADDAGFAARFYRALGVFLASRMRRSEQRLGYGAAADLLDEDVEHEDEIDPGLLDNVALAGRRFDWMLRRLRGES